MTSSSLRPPRTAGEITRALGSGGGAAPGTFIPAMVDGFPEPARRWLTRAIPAGAPILRRATLRMHGAIRLGRRWHDFTATQLLVPDAGFVWSARPRIAGVPVTGFDGYVGGAGVMRWRMLGVPIVRAVGDDVARSALDRLAAESVLLPTSMLDGAWSNTERTNSASFVASARPARSPVAVDVAPDGRLRSLRMRRWGDPAGDGYRRQPFTVGFDGEHDSGALVVPDGIRASWPESGGEFFRASLDGVTLD
jgi:hypothetical protein